MNLSSGDKFCRPYMYCRQRLLMPVLTAQSIALKHILSPPTICAGFNTFFRLNGDNVYDNPCHKLSPATEYAVNMEINFSPKIENCMILKYLCTIKNIGQNTVI